MITIRKKLKGLIPYRIVWFPSDAALRSLAEELPLTHIARVECASADVSGTASTVIEHHLSLTLCVELRRSLDEIFSRFSSTTRNLIRRAEKLGSRIRLRRHDASAENTGMVDEFVEFFNELVRHKHGALFPMSRQLAHSYFPHAELSLLDFDDRLLCAHLCMRDPEAGKVRLLYSVSRRFQDPDTSRVAGIANIYLHWLEFQKYRETGFAMYDLGGISPVDDPGINRFKLQFGGELVREHNYWLAGTPIIGNSAFALITKLTGRGKRRRAVQRAGERWRDLPLEEIRRDIERPSARPSH
jgi:hypothetical protein